MPLGTEVDFGPGHIVFDGVLAPRERGQQPGPLFSVHVYCGHGRPSQLLLSQSSLRGHSLNLHKKRVRPDVAKFCFSNRVVNEF